MGKATQKRVSVQTMNGNHIKRYVVSDVQADEVMKILDGIMNEK